jgi:hypothetical protein
VFFGSSLVLSFGVAFRYGGDQQPVKVVESPSSAAVGSSKARHEDWEGTVSFFVFFGGFDEDVRVKVT